MTNPPVDRRPAIAGGVVLVGLGILLAWLVVAVFGSLNGRPLAPASEPTSDPVTFAYAQVRPAPALELTDQDGRPFTLASLRGRPVLVFFGYTHCPDVCPATVGVVSQALLAVGEVPRAVFVSIDPERDDVAAMKQYLRYLPPAFIGLSGTPAAVRRNADAWDVRYVKQETGSANGYAMGHTADIFLVDGQGMLRAHFPFGTGAGSITASLRALLAEGPPASGAPVATPLPTSSATTPALTALAPTVVSSSVWSGGQSPVILTVEDAAGARLDGSVPLDVRLVNADGSPAGADVPATAILPVGDTAVSFVAVVDIPSPGDWRLDVLAADGRTGTVQVHALDPGGTAALGQPAPAIRTPTLDDAGGVVRAVTTQPNPDLRLSQTSTADARAAGKPYVLVIDSARFKVSPACGRALTMIRYLLDRWPGVAFIHLEPFEYQVITEEPVLSGDIANPPLNRYASAFGLGPAPWPATEMPWVFVVDGGGIVRAKYTGIVGSADVDLIVSLITGAGVIAR